MNDSSIDRPLIFRVASGALRERADVSFAAGSVAFDRLYAEPRFELRSLGSLATKVQYGISSQAHAERIGYPIIRMNNLQKDGWKLGDLKYVELPVAEFENYRLVPGDILVNRTNGSRDLVGKCEVFRESGDWVFASYLIRVQINRGLADPEFVAAFLNTDAGRAQVLRASRQILMSNVNASELKELLIPLPELVEQGRLVEMIARARSERENSEIVAQEISLSVLPKIALALGLDRPPAEHAKAWTVSLATVRASDRLDPGPFHPERRANIDYLEHCGHPVRRVGSLVTAERVSEADPGVVVGMANVASNTGELIPGVALQESLSGVAFLPGDVLIGKLRPRLNKVYYATAPGFCSPEFVVLRPTNDEVDGEYLAHALRLPSTVAQLIHLVSGNTLPRVTADDILGLRLPLPPRELQLAIVSDANRLQQVAIDARIAAESGWARAKSLFQNELLGASA